MKNKKKQLFEEELNRVVNIDFQPAFPSVKTLNEYTENSDLYPIRIVDISIDFENQIDILFEIDFRKRVDVYLFVNGRKYDMFYKVKNGKYRFQIKKNRVREIKLFYTIGDTKSPSQIIYNEENNNEYSGRRKNS